MSEYNTVLIVDDDAEVRLTMEALLKSERHQLRFATDGEEGLRMANEAPPDVILLDVMMPGMDGYEVCRRLKADPTTAHIPVLLVTALAERQDRLKGIEAGANDYLNKPIDAQDLRLRVRNAIYTKKLYDQLQHSFEQLKQLEVLRDNLTHMIVHDMRSSLCCVLGYTQMLRESAQAKLDESEADYVEKIERSTNLLVNMVVSLLDISRLEAGQMPIQRTSCHLEELVSTAIQPLESLKGKREITASFPAAPIKVDCDHDLVQRIIANLVGNAIKHTEDGGTIQVTATQRDGTTKIAITDNGPGIPPELHQRIFEKFGQVKSTQRARGVGLGLTFSKLAVEAHGGTIGLDSQVGQGSTFWFTLPPPPPV